MPFSRTACPPTTGDSTARHTHLPPIFSGANIDCRHDRPADDGTAFQQSELNAFNVAAFVTFLNETSVLEDVGRCGEEGTGILICLLPHGQLGAGIKLGRIRRVETDTRYLDPAVSEPVRPHHAHHTRRLPLIEPRTVSEPESLPRC